MLFLLISATALVNFSNKFCNKKLQTIFPKGKSAYAFYALITGIVSTINFLIMTGFSLQTNFQTVLFALFYAIICRASYFVAFRSLKYNGVFMSDVFSRVGTILPPILISALFFGEIQGKGTILGALCVCAAAVLPYTAQKNVKTQTNRGFVWALAILALSTCSTMLLKSFVSLQGAENMLSYYLLTNVFIAVSSAVSLIAKCGEKGGRDEIASFKAPHYLLTLAVTFTSNLGGFVSRYLVEFMGVIPNTVIGGALDIFVTIMISMYFRERLKRRLVCALLCLASAILPVLIK